VSFDLAGIKKIDVLRNKATFILLFNPSIPSDRMNPEYRIFSHFYSKGNVKRVYDSSAFGNAYALKLDDYNNIKDLSLFFTFDGVSSKVKVHHDEHSNEFSIEIATSLIKKACNNTLKAETTIKKPLIENSLQTKCNNSMECVCESIEKVLGKGCVSEKKIQSMKAIREIELFSRNYCRGFKNEAIENQTCFQERFYKYSCFSVSSLNCFTSESKCVDICARMERINKSACIDISSLYNSCFLNNYKCYSVQTFLEVMFRIYFGEYVCFGDYSVDQSCAFWGVSNENKKWISEHVTEDEPSTSSSSDQTDSSNDNEDKIKNQTKSKGSKRALYYAGGSIIGVVLISVAVYVLVF